MHWLLLWFQCLQGAARDAVKFAIDVGYCNFDFAYMYQKESKIGDALRLKIQEGIMRREGLFVVNKVCPWIIFLT